MKLEREYEVHTEDHTRTWVVYADVSGDYVRATWETPAEGPEVEIEGARCVETKERVDAAGILKLLADAEGIAVDAMETRIVEEFAEDAAEYSDHGDDDSAYDRMRDGD